jgi:hypothetical protein
VRRRRYKVTEMYALVYISNQMLEHSAFDMEDAEIRPHRLASAARRMPRWAVIVSYSAALHRALPNQETAVP